MLTHAFLLAAGRGERMRPLTDSTPKPLLKVQGKALIEWHIERLARAGITHIVINHAWLGQQIEDYLGDGRRYGVQLQYSAENIALETAAGIKKALPLLSHTPFLVISSDVWTTWDAIEAHSMSAQINHEQALANLLLVPNPEHHLKGDFSLSENRLRLITTGPSYTYSGIGVYSPAFFQKVSSQQPTPLRAPLHQAMKKNAVLGHLFTGEWMDIGTPDRLKQIEQNLALPR